MSAMLPLRYIAGINERALPEDTDPGREFRYADISSVGRGELLAEPQVMRFGDAPSRARRLVQRGDTIVSTVRTYLRAVWPVPGECDDLVVSTGFAVLTPRSVDPRYFSWWVSSDAFIEEVVARSVGVSYPAINAFVLGELPVRVPSAAEQRGIADFLDTETARIDALMAKKQRLAAVLAESVESKVTQVYIEATETHGAMRLGRLLRGLEQGWSPQCENRIAEPDEYGILKAGCVNRGIFQPAAHKALPPGTSPRLEYRVQPGDLIMCRASGSLDLIGSTAVLPLGVPENLLLCDKLYRLRLEPNLSKHFVALMMLARPIREAIKQGTSGAEGMANNLPSGAVRGLAIPVAPPKRQEAIVTELSQLREAVRTLATALERSIQLLRERRQALITAAVTGKLQVPGVAA